MPVGHRSSDVSWTSRTDVDRTPYLDYRQFLSTGSAANESRWPRHERPPLHDGPPRENAGDDRRAPGRPQRGRAVQGVHRRDPGGQRRVVLPRAGKLFTLLGPSGSGKTTTLRSSPGSRRRTRARSCGGRLVYSSKEKVDVAVNRRGLGMVFQSYAIWPHMTVFENVAYPLTVDGRRSASPKRDQGAGERGAGERAAGQPGGSPGATSCPAGSSSVSRWRARW